MVFLQEQSSLCIKHGNGCGAGTFCLGSQLASMHQGDICARAGAALGLCKHAGPATLKSGTEEVLQSGINMLLL